MADRIHCVEKTIRITPYVAYSLSEKAKKTGMRDAAYLRLLISQRPNDYGEARIIIRDLINEVNAIGNNINQNTRNHNSGLYSADDRELLKASMKKLNYLVKDTIGVVDRLNYL